jgi:hypothetical protein
MEKLLKIKGLHVHDGAVTGNWPLRPMFGAVVEFSTRAGIGLARD